MTELRVLTVRQPWASLIALGHKRIEVRSRPTNYRGWVAIHAGKATPDPLWEGGGYAIARDGDGPFLYHGSLAFADRLPLGAIVAVVRLTDSLPLDLCRLHSAHLCAVGRTILLAHSPINEPWPNGNTEHDHTDQLPYAPAEMWTLGHHGWLLDDVRQLDEPIVHTGGLGLRRPAPELAEQLAPYCTQDAP